MVKESCTSYATQFATGTGVTGLLIGFFQAHGATTRGSGAAKGSTAINIIRVGKQVARPVGLFAGLGFTYAAAECATEHFRGKEDSVSGIVAGLATGAAAGVAKGSVPAAVGWGLLFAAGSIAADFFSKVATAAFKDVKSYGPADQPAAGKTLS